jgi:peptide/nickel transport system ATP-binding protein
VLQLLDQCRRESGVALLMVSHDPDVVRLLCARTITMREGRFVGAVSAPV